MSNNAARAMKKAQSLKKQHPSWSNATALKAGWKAISGVRRKTSPSKRKKVSGVARRKKASTPRPRKVSRSVSGSRKPTAMGAVRANASETRRILEGAIGEFMARQYFAKTKTEKRKIGKKIAELKRQARAASAIIKKSHGKG